MGDIIFDLVLSQSRLFTTGCSVAVLKMVSAPYCFGEGEDILGMYMCIKIANGTDTLWIETDFM